MLFIIFSNTLEFSEIVLGLSGGNNGRTPPQRRSKVAPEGDLQSLPELPGEMRFILPLGLPSKKSLFNRTSDLEQAQPENGRTHQSHTIRFILSEGGRSQLSKCSLSESNHQLTPPYIIIYSIIESQIKYSHPILMQIRIAVGRLSSLNETMKTSPYFQQTK